MVLNKLLEVLHKSKQSQMKLLCLVICISIFVGKGEGITISGITIHPISVEVFACILAIISQMLQSNQATITLITEKILSLKEKEK